MLKLCVTYENMMYTCVSMYVFLINVVHGFYNVRESSHINYSIFRSTVSQYTAYFVHVVKALSIFN